MMIYKPRHAAQSILDRELGGWASALLGLVLGLIVWPVILWCYFG